QGYTRCSGHEVVQVEQYVSLWYFRYTMEKDKLLLRDSEQHTGIGWH
ncbi:hypothetical protein A2U01_0098725, partial [Trifolium medium]|nr:hypothetical protein [Trifolium medium]